MMPTMDYRGGIKQAKKDFIGKGMRIHTRRIDELQRKMEDNKFRPELWEKGIVINVRLEKIPLISMAGYSEIAFPTIRLDSGEIVEGGILDCRFESAFEDRK